MILQRKVFLLYKLYFIFYLLMQFNYNFKLSLLLAVTMII
jgi:hypothetical protein